MTRRNMLKVSGSMVLSGLAAGVVSKVRVLHPHLLGAARPQWGLNGNWSQGMSTSDRYTRIHLASQLGCVWIEDHVTWVNMADDAARLAKMTEAVSQTHGAGLKYFASIIMTAPVSEPGGGGAYYPTDPTDYATYVDDFGTWLASFISDTDVDAVAIGHEMTGPTYWLPDGNVANQVAANISTICAAYKTLYDKARAVAPASVLVVASTGDSDTGYVSNWLTNLATLGFRPDAVCPYDYHSQAGPGPCYTPGCGMIWGYPESDYGDAMGSTADNINYYARISKCPVIVPEAGYQIGDAMTDGVTITQAVQADLWERTFSQVQRSGAAGYFIHSSHDDVGSSECGIINDDLTVRPAYTRLAGLIGGP